MMSSAIKVLVVLVVLAGAGFAVWWSGWFSKPTMAPTSMVEQATTTPQAADSQQNMNGMSDAKDASDAAFVQDTAAIDSQMQGLSSDSTNLDSSLSDKQTQQAY